MTAGYRHPGYAEALADFGTPRALPRSKGWILERAIPGTPLSDAMGCYPLFCCQDWNGLGADLDMLEGELVSLALVTDPFGAYTRRDLQCCFRDLVRPYKEHYVIDLRQDQNRHVSKHHRRNARRGLRQVEVEVCAEPLCHLDEWVRLYASLAEKHEIQGMRAFSRASFEKQLQLPGTVLLRALHEGRTVGMDLWYVQDDVGYGHLAAYDPVGYRTLASYALLWVALEYLAGTVRWLDLGAGAGLDGAAEDGLTHFKRGWATGTRPVYFCGRILNRTWYARLTQDNHARRTAYFPAYRAGEFA